MFGGREVVVLRSGATLRCGMDSTQRPAPPFVSLERGAPTGDAERVSLPYPHAGLGGLELVVSPDERHAALFVYSGQAEQGWELFALEPSLRRVSALPYVPGMGNAPAFSPDGRWLVMAVVTTARVRGSGPWAEDALDGGEGRVLVDWARLYVQAVPGGPLTTVALGTWVDRTLPLETLGDWRIGDTLEFVDGEDMVFVPLPWGRVQVPLPPADAITT